MSKNKKWLSVLLTAITVIFCFSMILPAFAADDTEYKTAYQENLTPVQGTRKTLTFVVYRDSDPNAPKTAAQEKNIISQVKDFMYGASGKILTNDNDVYSDEDSLRGWYYRSSYGKLDIIGDVYILRISEDDENSYHGYSQLLNMAYEQYKTKINWNSYLVSSNNAQYSTIKGVYFIQGSERSVSLYSGNNALGDVMCTSVDDSKTHMPLFYADCTGFAYQTSQHILENNRRVIGIVAHET